MDTLTGSGDKSLSERKTAMDAEIVYRLTLWQR